jgi:hypothetical protein
LIIASILSTTLYRETIKLLMMMLMTFALLAAACAPQQAGPQTQAETSGIPVTGSTATQAMTEALATEAPMTEASATETPMTEALAIEVPTEGVITTVALTVDDQDGPAPFLDRSLYITM